MIVKAVQGKKSSILWPDLEDNNSNQMYNREYAMLTDKNEELFQLIRTSIEYGDGL